MAYEWDPAKVRKSYMIKMLVVCGAAVVLASFPLWMIINAITL